MKIALAQLNYHIGNFESNISKIRHAIKLAKASKADLVVFAELAVCGYPPRDFLEFRPFISACEKALNEIAADCEGIAAIVGAPVINPDKKGKGLYNAACFICDGKIKSVHYKALLPNYDVFDEYRYFEPGREFSLVEYRGTKIALTICEDIWDVDPEPMYTLCPMDELVKQKPDFMINISASPFNYSQHEERKKIVRGNAVKYHIPVVYVNHIGSQTELIFDGGSMVSDSKGDILLEMAYFEEEIKYFEFSPARDPSVISNDSPVIYQGSKIQRMHDALVLGICDYFGKMNFSKAILGLSGGIDSAVVLALASKALGNDKVKALLLPSPFSSEHSVKDAVLLAQQAGCPFEIIEIKNEYESFLTSLKPYFNNTPFNIAEENIQARLRAILLMAFSNKFGYILLNTSNKSELAVGYGTLYGDMCGGLSVLGDLYKTEVYELASYINRIESEKYGRPLIPQNIIDKAPSAELRPNQKDSDSLPEYYILDKILYQYIELRKSPDEITAMGYEETLVKKILQMVNTNEYKRYQFPPILRVSPKAFGMGRRMPIVGKYL